MTSSFLPFLGIRAGSGSWNTTFHVSNSLLPSDLVPDVDKIPMAQISKSQNNLVVSSCVDKVRSRR